MKKVNIKNISNVIVIDSEENEEFEGICGTDDGILWEDSLEQFFEANAINIIDYEDHKWIILEQNGEKIKFNMFEGREGSSFLSVIYTNTNKKPSGFFVLLIII